MKTQVVEEVEEKYVRFSKVGHQLQSEQAASVLIDSDCRGDWGCCGDHGCCSDEGCCGDDGCCAKAD